MNIIKESTIPKRGDETPHRALKDYFDERPFLSGLSEQHQQTLIDCAMLQEFREGERIFCEGDPANRCYLILEGEVVLESAVREEDSILIETIGAGEVLGWSWLFPPYYWHFAARATKPTKAIFFYGTRLRQLCDQDTSLGYELMKRIASVVIQRVQATRKELLKSTHRRS
ncbi:MAG: Crp/Fnr family transcriptional regulator [Verrucomicrobiales bacterium]|nr:Crp/Fnr family transcriptional regulator [Verrucomicrobiales bacterium]